MYGGPLNVEHPGTNNGEGFSPEIWSQSHLFEIQQDKEAGWWWGDRFDDGKEASGVYTKTQATAGTWATTLEAGQSGVAAGGWGEADSGSTTATQGIQWQYTHLGFIPRVDAIICFEMVFRLVDATVGPELFFGLSESDTTVISSSAMSSNNYIGFQSLTDDRVILGTAEKATITPATLVTIATAAESDTLAGTEARPGTTHKMGCVIDGIKGCKWYWDGAEIANSTTDGLAPNFIPGTHIPIVFMVPTLVLQSGGTDDPILFDWCHRFSQFDRTVLLGE